MPGLHMSLKDRSQESPHTLGDRTARVWITHRSVWKSKETRKCLELNARIQTGTHARRDLEGAHSTLPRAGTDGGLPPPGPVGRRGPVTGVGGALAGQAWRRGPQKEASVPSARGKGGQGGSREDTGGVGWAGPQVVALSTAWVETALRVAGACGLGTSVGRVCGAGLSAEGRAEGRKGYARRDDSEVSWGKPALTARSTAATRVAMAPSIPERAARGRSRTQNRNRNRACGVAGAGGGEGPVSLSAPRGPVGFSHTTSLCGRGHISSRPN